MSLRKRIEVLRDEARSLTEDKEFQIEPLRLSAELDRILSQSDAYSEHLLRKYQWRIELWRETKLEITKATISFSQAVIRSLVLINGGAAIAVMTFIGGYPSEQKSLIFALSWSLLYFSFGVAFAAFVGGCAYVTQFLYDGSTDKISKWGVLFHIVAVICAIISLALFVLGLLGAFWGFTGALQA